MAGDDYDNEQLMFVTYIIKLSLSFIFMLMIVVYVFRVRNLIKQRGRSIKFNDKMMLLVILIFWITMLFYFAMFLLKILKI